MKGGLGKKERDLAAFTRSTEKKEERTEDGVCKTKKKKKV